MDPFTIIDVETNTVVKQLFFGTPAIAFSPDGQFYLFSDGKALRLRDADSQRDAWQVSLPASAGSPTICANGSAFVPLVDRSSVAVLKTP